MYLPVMSILKSQVQIHQEFGSMQQLVMRDTLKVMYILWHTIITNSLLIQSKLFLIDAKIIRAAASLPQKRKLYSKTILATQL